MISSDFFNCENCPALPESPACLNCTFHTYFNHSFKKYVVPFVGIYSGVRDYLSTTFCKDCKDNYTICSCADFRVRFMEIGKQFERFV